jgi:tetratricopeptide (TPR) repeat protein
MKAGSGPAHVGGGPFQVGTSTPLVGRAKELDRAMGFLAAARSGAGSVLGIHGEAGAGKTRFLAELRRRAQEEGYLVLAATCQAMDQSTPYAPWVELVRSYVATRPRSEVFARLGPHLAVVARIVPELHDLVWLRQDPPPPPAPTERRPFLNALARFFVGLGEAGPVLLVLDDVAWADAGSLDLVVAVGRLARSHTVALAIAYRNPATDRNEALDRALGEMEVGRTFESLPLSTFDRPETEALIRVFLHPTPPPPALIDAVYARSEGNAFYTAEVLQTWLDAGDLSLGSGGWQWRRTDSPRVLPSVRRAIGAHLELMDEATRRVAGNAAVLGTSFSLPLLERMTGLEGAQLTGPLERLELARILTERTHPDGRVEIGFVHPLLLETVAETVSPAGARTMHLRAGDLLEKEPSLAPAADSATLAYHFRQGGATAKALVYSRQAAEHAAEVFAREEAARHYRNCLELLGPRGDPRERATLLERMADQYRGLAVTSAAVDGYERAAGEWERLGEPVAAGDCLRRAAECFVGLAAREKELSERAHRLLSRGPQGPEYLALQLWDAFRLYTSGDVPAAMKEFEAARALAVSLGRVDGEIQARLRSSLCVPMDRRAEFSEITEGVWRYAESLGIGAVARGPVIFNRAVYLYHCLGRLRDAIDVVQGALEAARAVGDREVEIWWTGFAIPWAMLRTGDLKPAAALIEQRRQTVAFLGRFGWAPESEAAGVRAWVATLLGPPEVARPLLAEATAAGAAHPSWFEDATTLQFVARLELGCGRPAAAIRPLEESDAIYRRTGPPAFHALFHAEVLSLLVRAHMELGEPDRARARCTELAEIARRFDSEPTWAFLWTGQSLLEPEQEESLARIDKAQATWEKLGWGYEAACTLRVRGCVLAAAGRVDEARAAWTGALARFEQMGAEPDARITRAMSDGRGGQSG